MELLHASERGLGVRTPMPVTSGSAAMTHSATSFMMVLLLMDQLG